MRKPALSRKGGPKQKRVVTGGPWHGKTVLVPTGGTMVFRLGTWEGRYSSNGEWESVLR